MIRYLIEKEFKQLYRNKFILLLVIMLPAIVMLVFPWTTTMEIKNLSITVLDNDRSELSRKLIDKISSTEYFDITQVAFSREEAMQDIEYGESDIIIEIPKGFDEDIVSGGTSVLQFSANAVNGAKASLGTSYLEQVVIGFSDEINTGEGAALPYGAGIISVEPYYWFNPEMDYKVPMIPMLLVLIVALITGFLPAMNIVGEKETGTIEQINVTPVPKLTFIVGKLIPYWVIGLVVLSLGLLVSYLLYGLSPKGSLLLLYALSFVFIFGISGMGLVISNYSENMQQAMFMIFFVIIIFLLMSGIFTPISSMPEWAQIISKISPFTYFAEIMKMIYLKGSDLREVSIYVYPLLIFFAVIISWAVISYRKRG